MTNIDYLAAIAEDTWFDDARLARRVSERIGKQGSHGHYLPRTTALNAIDMGRYIAQRATERLSRSSRFLYEPQDQISATLEAIGEAVTAARREQGYGDAWEGAASRYPKGTVVEGVICSIKNFGAFVEVERGLTGLLPRAMLENPRAKAPQKIQRGAQVKVKILSIDEMNYRIEMDLA